jgi:hypothetical protein
VGVGAAAWHAARTTRSPIAITSVTTNLVVDFIKFSSYLR